MKPKYPFYRNMSKYGIPPSITSDVVDFPGEGPMGKQLDRLTARGPSVPRGSFQRYNEDVGTMEKLLAEKRSVPRVRPEGHGSFQRYNEDVRTMEKNLAEKRSVPRGPSAPRGSFENYAIKPSRILIGRFNPTVGPDFRTGPQRVIKNIKISAGKLAPGAAGILSALAPLAYNKVTGKQLHELPLDAVKSAGRALGEISPSMMSAVSKFLGVAEDEQAEPQEHNYDLSSLQRLISPPGMSKEVVSKKPINVEGEYQVPAELTDAIARINGREIPKYQASEELTDVITRINGREIPKYQASAEIKDIPLTPSYPGKGALRPTKASYKLKGLAR